MYSSEKISENIFVFTSKQHTFGTDAVLLSEFTAPKKNDRVVDIGTGCGIIPMYMANKYSPKYILGVDIQPQAIEQFNMAIQNSALDTNVQAELCDAKDISKEYNCTFDVVCCNPPYKANGAGILSETESDKIARHETMLSMDDLCSIAARLLRFGGRFCLCQRPERLVDILYYMRKNGVEPKKVQFVSKNKDTSPWLVLVEGKKGSKPF
ncbi:MAG: methyltransferase, partial [Oscillospiraceae bacterium]